MTIENTELKEMVGKRITIDGERHRVAKVSVRAGTLTTVDGATVEVDGIYKRGRGYFFDTPKKGKKSSKVADEAPKETARQRRQREREEAEAAASGKSKRGRNRGGKKADEEVETPRERRRREKAEAAESGTKSKAKAPAKKKLVKAFDQAIAERVTQEVQDSIARALAEHGTYAIVPIAAGATFTEKDVKVTITLMSSEASSKEIDAYIREHRNSTDIAPEDEEEDELEELEDDDAEDEDLDEEEVDDEDLEDDEEDEDEDDEEDEDEDDEEVEDDSPSIDDLVASIVEDYPNLKEDKVRGFVEAYLTSEAVEDKLGDELMPGVTRLHKKGSELELLLVGFDEDEEAVKLLNTETGKFRSASIDDVVRMEIVEDEEEDDE